MLLVPKDLLVEGFRHEYQCGREHGQMCKEAGTPKKVHALTGELYLSESGWLMLRVPASLVRGMFDALSEPGWELQSHDGKLVPHISVMTKDEVAEIGADSISERGHHYHYTLGPIKEVEPHGQSDVFSKVVFCEVDSPELRQLRKSYGLEPLSRGFAHHITIAYKRRAVTQNSDVTKLDGAKAAAAAEGIPDRADFGDLSKLQAGQLIKMIVQKHQARRAGLHHDVRLGDEDGLHSWAVRKGLPEPGGKHLAVHQPIHSHAYKDFEGTIPSGYGAGEVSKLREEDVLVTYATPDEVHFTTGESRAQERFVLKRTADKHFLLLNTTPTKPLEHEKVRYTSVPAEQAENLLKNLQPGSSVQAKIDGAASLTRLFKDKAEVVSYRASVSGKPIVHSERIFGGKPKLDIPKQFRNLTLRGELYGVENASGKAIPAQTLGGLLNSGVAKSLRDQQSRGQSLRQLVFDFDPPGAEPYADRLRKLREILPHLPSQIHGPDEATTPQEALRLWEKIRTGKNPISREGVVVHPPTGKPTKIKLMDEHDVHLRGFAPGQGRFAGKGIGAFTYSHEPEGPIVGEVGTGLSDELRREMHENPLDFIGRVAKVRAQNRFPSGALRAPSLLSLHEDLPLAKTAGSMAAIGMLDDLVALQVARRNAERRRQQQQQTPPLPAPAPSRNLLDMEPFKTIAQKATSTYRAVVPPAVPGPSPTKLASVSVKFPFKLPREAPDVVTIPSRKGTQRICPRCNREIVHDLYTDKNGAKFHRSCFGRGAGPVKEAADAKPVKHCIIVGGSGAGKTTLAKKLAEKTGLPIHKIDRDELYRNNRRLSRSEHCYTTGHPIAKEWHELRIKLINRALSLKEPHIIEGTHLLADLSLADKHRVILIDTPPAETKRRRLNRDEELGKLKRDGKAVREGKADFLLKSLAPEVEKFRDHPDVEKVTPEETDKWLARQRKGGRRPSVAMDLDGTITEDGDWKGGEHFHELRKGAVEGMKELKRRGFEILINTCRGDVAKIKEFLNKHEIPFDAINENPVKLPNTSHKLTADVYPDDRGLDASMIEWEDMPDRIDWKLGAMDGQREHRERKKD